MTRDRTIPTAILALVLGTMVLPGMASAQSVELDPYRDLSRYLLVNGKPVPASSVGLGPGQAAPGGATDGFGNTAAVVQGGTGNNASLTQNGFGNIAATVQTGSDNSSALSATGDNNVLTSTQVGNGNSTAITVQGQSNQISDTQIGNGLSFGLTQIGNGKSVSIVQVHR